MSEHQQPTKPEGKKLSSFIKSRRSLSPRDQPSNTSTSSLSSSTSHHHHSHSNSSSNGGNNNNNGGSGELTPEEYNKRNTRQIPAILLEDDPEGIDEDYPFDFERYYYESKDINRETSRELVVIPDETTFEHLQLLPKENRSQTLPMDYKSGTNQQIDDCIDFYQSPAWRTIKTVSYNVDETPHSILNTLMEKKIEHKPLDESSAQNEQQQQQQQQQSDSMFQQSSGPIFKNDEVDELHMGYLERQLRVQNKQETHQKSLFSYFTLTDPPSSSADPNVYSKDNLYLFDISKKVRMSDTFHFDFNTDKTERLLGANQKTKDDIHRAKKALFTVSKSSTDIYLVLKVEKVLMGDIDDQSEPYIKLNIKDKEKDKLKDQIKSYCSRLGVYRQAFCWGCVPLFGDDGELGMTENTHFRPLYRYRPDCTDAQMIDSTMSEFSKSASTKKLKIIPGYCTVDLREVPNYHRSTDNPIDNTVVINPSLSPVTFTPPLLPESPSSSVASSPATGSTPLRRSVTLESSAGTISVGPDRLVREVQEFPLYPRFEPNMEFVHNLYIYPETVNLSNRSGSVTARNIAIKIQLMECDDNVNYDGMRLIYGRSNTELFTTRHYTSVTYHSKTPIFYDEVKIRLPINLNAQQHILFTFYHITCQKSDKESTFDAPIGHAVLPLLHNGKVLGDETFTLPIALELPPRYNKADTESALRYIDNKKPIFQVRSKLFSSIASTDDHINAFFHTISNPSASIDATIKAIRGLTQCKIEPIAQFFPVLANQLFRLMTSPLHSHELAMSTFISIGDLLSIVNDVSPLVHARYVKYVFVNSSLPDALPVYEVLIKTWLELMRFQEHNSDNILRFSKFFFSIIFKSMSLSLIERGKREENKTRKGRFVGVRSQLRKLISILRWEASIRVKHTFKLSKELVKSLAVLISSLLSIADRGYVFSIIDRVVSDFDSGNTGESEAEVNELKFEFLRIICQNEFFVQLNIPLPYRIDPTLKLNTILSLSKHFLSELLNHHITNGLAHKEVLVRMDAASSLRDTLLRIEMDSRWQDPLTKQRIVGVFVPYLSSVVNSWHVFKDDSFIVKRNILISFVYLLKSAHPNLIRLWWKEDSKAKYMALFEILTTCADIFEFVGKDKLLERALESASIRTSTAKSILEDFYTTNRTSPYGSNKKYQRSLREKRVESRKSILDSYASGSSSGSSGSGGTGALAKDKRGYSKGTMSTAGKINVADYDDRLESNLSFEVGSIVLDICDDFMYEFERELKSTPYYELLQKIFQLIHSMLSRNQPITLIPKLYFTMRQFVFKFPKSIFEMSNTFCSDLCNGVIRHCNSPNKTTREEASAFTYILMRKNYEQTRKNFVRTKTQIIIGLDKEMRDDYYLKKSLDTINAYANAQAEKLGRYFAKQVEDLTRRIHTFVIDNIKINNHRDDPEMVADLHHRIAENNKSIADTRLFWLQGLADFHKKQENFSEAAQCYLHMAALVSEYLSLIGAPIPTILGSSAFINVNRNALEESNTYIEREDDDNSQKFTIEFFISLVNNAILLLKDADLYETATLVYKVLIPVHEHYLNYEELAKCHGDLQFIFNRILECTRTKSRMLGSYYRVGFYGKKFDEINGQEFIYKEPKITRLVEIKDRLCNLVAKKFKLPEKAIHIIEGSNVVDVSKIDTENFVYIQITSVVPYFTHEEVATRRTPFDQCVNLNRFMFETPFTVSGAGQGNSVAEQYKRKTILTVQNHFPYTKKRILVTSKQEINLSPIENAIESIESRTETLQSEIRAIPPNLKTLQQVIQGTVRLQVNAGPQEICRIFLAEGTSYNYESIARLKRSLSVFLGACAESLQFNRSLIEQTSAALEFQDEMEQGYMQLLGVMESYDVGPPDGSYNPCSNNTTPTLTSTTPLSASSMAAGGYHDDGDGSANNSPASHFLSSSVSNANNASSSLAPSQTSRKSFTQRLSNSFKDTIVNVGGGNKKTSNNEPNGATPPEGSQ
eukprot:gene7631-8927_t